MAVKKVTTKATEVEVNEEVVENTTPVEETKDDVEETSVEKATEEVAEPVEIAEPVKEEEAKVEVDTEKAEVKESNKPSGSVKIRMRVDHKCTIAMECYDLKAGKTYIVPENVKRILNNAGLLAPL